MIEMELIEPEAFRSWAAERGIMDDPHFPKSGVLDFRDAPRGCSRGYETPPHASDLPGFLSTLMEGAAPSGPFVLFLRNGAPWFTGTGYDEGPIVEQLRDRIVRTLPIPMEFAGALRFVVGEWRDVLMLLATFLVYGWCVGDDLHLIPEDGNCILMTSHHGYVSVRCPDWGPLATFEQHMSTNGYRAAASEAADVPKTAD
jgi:hypothetical protein